MAEVSGLTDNNYDEADDTDPHLKIVDLEEKVSILEAQLQTKEQEVAEHQEKGSATQQTLSFLFTNCFHNHPMPDGTLELVQAMAAAKSPERFHDINVYRIFDIQPPLIPRVRPLHVIPETEFEMVLKIHTLLSGKPDDHDLATLVLLLSSLALRQPDSEFYPVIASLGSLWGKMKNVPADNPILLAILQFAMLQLTCAGDTRFIRPGFNRPSIPKLPNSTFSPTISKFAEAVFSMEEGIWTELAAELTRICRKSGLRFGFHYEAADRGCFAGKFEDIVLLIDFKHASGCISG